MFSFKKNLQNLIFFRCKDFSGPKFFLEPKFFQTHIFLRPKIFSDPKWTSMKTIFWGRKQSFCTWGFWNWQGQRIYLNWSLTLKTKSCFYTYSPIHWKEVNPNAIGTWSLPPKRNYYAPAYTSMSVARFARYKDINVSAAAITSQCVQKATWPCMYLAALATVMNVHARA